MHTSKVDYNRICPSCRYASDSAASPDGADPVDGDMSLCMNCGEFARFHTVDDELHLRALTDEEQEEMLTDSRAMYFQRVIKAAMK